MNDAGSVGAGELSASFDALMRIIKSEPRSTTETVTTTAVRPAVGQRFSDSGSVLTDPWILSTKRSAS